MQLDMEITLKNLWYAFNLVPQIKKIGEEVNSSGLDWNKSDLLRSACHKKLNIGCKWTKRSDLDHFYFDCLATV